jgi:hypothetical protein
VEAAIYHGRFAAWQRMHADGAVAGGTARCAGFCFALSFIGNQVRGCPRPDEMSRPPLDNSRIGAEEESNVFTAKDAKDAKEHQRLKFNAAFLGVLGGKSVVHPAVLLRRLGLCE